jgi:nucleoside-diphosphate-sugar epimerase
MSGDLASDGKRVLITGSRGLIGGILERALREDYEVTGLDFRRRGPIRDRGQDLRRPDSAAARFRGHDVVIDLAADPRAGAPWEAVYRNNLAATYGAFEAARRAGVRRVIFASSNHVTGLYEKDEPYASILAGRYEGLDPGAIPLITPGHDIRPDGYYGVGKAFGEALGRFYAEEHGLSVICVRIGTVTAANRPANPRHFATLLTHADLVRLMRSAIEAPAGVRFGIVYGVSGNRWRIWDLEGARREIGYVPEDDAERWR